MADESGAGAGLPPAAFERVADELMRARRLRDTAPPPGTYAPRPPQLRHLADFHPSAAMEEAMYGAGAGVLSSSELMLRAFLRRYTDLLFRLGEAAPAPALENALAAADGVSGLARLLADVGPLAVSVTDPLAAARARGAAAKAELLAEAGGALRAGEAAARLGVTPQAVHARRQRGTLLALPQANGELLYPLCQFDERHGVLPELGRVLRAFRDDDPWVRLSVLLAPAEGPGSPTPLQLLAAGEVERAVAAVARYGEHLA